METGLPERCRSMLFAPANQPKLLDKLPTSGADVVVVDLEDGVPADDESKAHGRRCVQEWVTRTPSFRHPVVLLRLNAVDTTWRDADVPLAWAPRIDGVVVPKAATTAELMSLRMILQSGRHARLRRSLVVAGIETVTGLAKCEVLATSGLIDGIYFGAEDYVTDIGGRRTPSSTEVLWARSRVVAAAALGRIAAFDQVVVDFTDDAAFRADAATARDLGYRGKMCIHPRQVELAHAAFEPSEHEIAFARRVVDAADRAAADGAGVIAVDGRMIDRPLVERARAVVSASQN